MICISIRRGQEMMGDRRGKIEVKRKESRNQKKFIDHWFMHSRGFWDPIYLKVVVQSLGLHHWVHRPPLVPNFKECPSYSRGRERKYCWGGPISDLNQWVYYWSLVWLKYVPCTDFTFISCYEVIACFISWGGDIPQLRVFVALFVHWLWYLS